MRSITTKSVEETVALGARLGALLQPGDFIALTGELGAGKTHFARGVAAGLGVDPSHPVTSPTYTLMNIHEGRITLYHFDLYRLSGDGEIMELGFDEFFHGRGVCLVEWADRLRNEIPPERLNIELAHAGEEERTILFDAHGDRHISLLSALFGPQ